MKFRYTRYTGNNLEGLDLEELVSKLSSLLLDSGFGSPAGDPDDPFAENDQRSEQSLHDAILEALLNDGVLSDETIDRLLGDPADSDSPSRLEELIEQIIQAMEQEGYITRQPDPHAESGEGQGTDSNMRFEVTDKGLDFLGYRALRDLLSSTGHSSVGRHDTRDLSTGVDASGSPKPYEFGDTMNLDGSATILNAVRRLGRRRHRRGLPGSDGVSGGIPERLCHRAHARL